MKKYTLQFKRTVIEHYLTGQAGFTEVSRHHDVPRSLLQRWVHFYRLYGDAWFEKKVGRYSAAFKLSVLEHMWENDLSYGQVSLHFDIRDQCAVGQWDRSYQAGGFDALELRPSGRPKKMQIQKKTEPLPAPDEETRTRQELLVENRRLRMELEYLKKLDALVQSTKAAQRKKRKS
jgi:transposase